MTYHRGCQPHSLYHIFPQTQNCCISRVLVLILCFPIGEVWSAHCCTSFYCININNEPNSIRKKRFLWPWCYSMEILTQMWVFYHHSKLYNSLYFNLWELNLQKIEFRVQNTRMCQKTPSLKTALQCIYF